MTLRLSAEGLAKRYKKRPVVQNVSLHVETGEVVGLLGPNGAGKTTTFYMMLGLVNADAGRICLGDHDITALPMHARARLGLGYLPQEASIFRKLTVEDNILSVLQLRKDLKSHEREDILESLLGELNIDHIRRSEGIALSGGERRRAEIARTLATNPKFVLLDEPFAGVDPIAVGDIQSIIRHLQKRNIGVLITDHNVRETLSICTRAYVLATGQVITEGAPDAILNDERARQYYLGEDFRL